MPCRASASASAYPDGLAHRVSKAEQRLRNFRAQNSNFGDVLHLHSADELSRPHLVVTDREELRCNPQHLAEGALSPGYDGAAQGYLGRYQGHRGSRLGVHEGVRVLQSQGRPSLPSPGRPNEQQVGPQSLYRRRDLGLSAPAYRHGRYHGRHADHDAQKRQYGPKLVGAQGGNRRRNYLERVHLLPPSQTLPPASMGVGMALSSTTTPSRTEIILFV